MSAGTFWAAQRALRATSPSEEGLQRVAGDLGGQLVAIEELHGGVLASAHGIDIRSGDGSVSRYLLKRYIRDSDMPSREWRCLSAARAVPFPTPEPILLDEAGAWFDTPALIMSRLPGSATYRVSDADTFCASVAAALAAVHSTPLPVGDGALRSSFYWQDHDPAPGNTDVAVRAGAAEFLRRRPSALERQSVFSHGDFHPQNVLFDGDRVTALIDWGGAAAAPPEVDIATCRIALALFPGGDLPDRFLAACQEQRDISLESLACWDLMAGVEACDEGREWFDAIHKLDASLTVEDVLTRAKVFLDAAIRRAT